jgi:hypothetical protein
MLVGIRLVGVLPDPILLLVTELLVLVTDRLKEREGSLPEARIAQTSRIMAVPNTTYATVCFPLGVVVGVGY